MNKNHFDIMEKEIGKIKLLRMEFVELDKIIQFPAVEFNATEDSYLMCSLALHVFNPEMTYLGNEFDVRMILNNNLQDENANKFTFRVSSAEHTVRVYDTFTLEPGQNMIELYARLELGDVEFSKVELKCLRFIRYPSIDQYSDD